MSNSGCGWGRAGVGIAAGAGLPGARGALQGLCAHPHPRRAACVRLRAPRSPFHPCLAHPCLGLWRTLEGIKYGPNHYAVPTKLENPPHINRLEQIIRVDGSPSAPINPDLL